MRAEFLLVISSSLPSTVSRLISCLMTRDVKPAYDDVAGAASFCAIIDDPSPILLSASRGIRAPKTNGTLKLCLSM